MQLHLKIFVAFLGLLIAGLLGQRADAGVQFGLEWSTDSIAATSVVPDDGPCPQVDEASPDSLVAVPAGTTIQLGSADIERRCISLDETSEILVVRVPLILPDPIPEELLKVPIVACSY